MKRSKFINILLIICPIAILWHWGVISFDFGKINLNNIFGTGFYFENGFIKLKGNEYPPELIWFLLFCVSIIVLLYRIFSPERKIQHDSNNKENIIETGIIEVTEPKKERLSTEKVQANLEKIGDIPEKYRGYRHRSMSFTEQALRYKKGTNFPWLNFLIAITIFFVFVAIRVW